MKRNTVFCNFSELPLSTSLINVYCIVCLCRFLFLLVLWLGICVEVDVDRITIRPAPLSRFLFPIHNSFFNTSDSYLKSARLKLVSVPFSSLVLYIGHPEKSLPESIM